MASTLSIASFFANAVPVLAYSPTGTQLVCDNGAKSIYHDPNLKYPIFEIELAEQPITPSYIVNVLLQEGSKNGLQEIASQYPDLLRSFWGEKQYSAIMKGKISDDKANEIAITLLSEVLFNEPGQLIRYPIAGSVYGYVRVSDVVIQRDCRASCKTAVDTIMHCPVLK